jgi:hypothetical protein
MRLAIGALSLHASRMDVQITCSLNGLTDDARESWSQNEELAKRKTVK